MRRRSFLAWAAVLSQIRRLSAQATLTLDGIEKLLAPGFRGPSFTPAESRVIRSGKSLEVRRIVYGPQGPQTRGAFRSWLSEFTAIHTADFQTTAVEGQKTHVRYEIVGSAAGFHREQRVGYWLLEWKDGAIQSLEAEPEIRSRSAHAWFTDITEQTLGPTPELRSVDYWRTVLDGASGIDIYGHNGVSVGDIDGSGFDSIYICQPAGVPNRLYLNRGDGTFEDITRTSGVDLLDNTACALFADFNNHGRQDLLIVRASGPLLFLNQGGGKFRLKPDAFAFANPPRGTFTGAAAADYDRDGWLDVYFCLYTFYQGADQYNYPTPYYDAENGPPNFLMRNNRDGTFRDVTAEAGMNVNNTRFSFCCGWGDFNGNGRPDLYVVNDFGRKNLYRNNGDGTFTDVAAQMGVEDPGAGMGVCWFDYDNDGAEDLYVADMWTAAGERVSARPDFQPDAPPEARALYRKHAMGNSLFHNSGARFENKATLDNTGMGRWAWSCDAWDFDHDGYPDLYIANGMISGPQREDLNDFFWKQVVAKSPNTARPAPEYEQGWNEINDRIRSDLTWSGYERNVFYANNRDGTFSDVSGAVDLDFIEDGRAFALADFDHDGRLEVLLKNRNEPHIRLLKNVAPDLPPSIVFHLDAIGASVTMGRQTRRVQAGSGFLSQHSKELLFGLGEARGPVSATIRWPGGAVQELKDLPINHRIYLKQGTPPRIEAFAVARPLKPSKARRAEPLPAAFETLLLAPVPMPQTRSDAVMSILFRYLFDRRREIPPGARLEIDETGLLTKVSLGQARDARLPGNSETYVCGRNYLSLGSVYFQRGLLEPAEHFFTLALKDDPSSAEAYYGLGSVYLKLDRRDEARANFEQALKANAGYRDTGPNAWNNLGLLATRDGRLDEAVRCFKEALKLSPDYWISLENLGNAYRQMGRPAEARTALERALALNPRDPGSNYSLGMVFAQTGDAGQAEQYLTKALALKPDYPEALNNLGILYLRTRRRDQAVAKFEESIRVAPAFDQAYLNLARVYALEGSKAEARRVLDALLQQHQGHPQALQMLEELR